MSTLDWIKVVISGLTFLSTVGIFAWARKKYIHYRKNRDVVRDMQYKMLENVMDDLNQIKHQVQPNGGTSMNDKISDIAKHLVDIDSMLIDLKVRQRNASEILDIAYWESDSEGRTVFVSTALCDMIGRTSSTLMDFRWSAYLVVEDRDRVMKEWNESVRSAGEFNSVYSYVKSNGEVQKVNGRAIHNIGSDGKVLNSLGRLIKIN